MAGTAVPVPRPVPLPAQADVTAGEAAEVVAAALGSPISEPVADSLAAVLLVDVATGAVVHANALARQLAPGVELPVDVAVWSDAAGLRDVDGSALSGTRHPLSLAARGVPVPGATVTALRASDATEAQEPLYVLGLPLQGAPSLEQHTLVVLLPLRDARAGDDASREQSAQQLVRDRALLATGCSFTLADASVPDLPLLWVNPAFTATTGYSSEEVVGRNCRFLQCPETDPAQVAAVRDAIDRGTDVTVVLLNQRKDGSRFWNQVTVTPVLDAEGVVTHFVGVQVDVTDRVDAELAYQRAYDAERLARADAEAAREQAEDIGRRLTMVSEVSHVLSETLDVDEALQRLSALVVPELADWMVVSLLDERGRTDHVLTRHRDGHEHLLERWRALQPAALTDDSATARALRTGEPVLVAQVGEQHLAQAVQGDGAAELRDVLAQLGSHSAVVVPLVARRRVLGTLALLMGPSGRAFDEADARTATDVGRRAALALDNARLYAGEHRTALTLQRSLLPALPTIPGLSLASAYIPGNHRAEVGGDWWDVFSLSRGQSCATALAVGDVMGHDIAAAAAMGQLRSVLRTCAWGGDQPATVLERMDRLVQGFDMAQLATCLYARLDPADGPTGRRRTPRLYWSNAGHPPPVVLAPDGRAALLEGALGVPIGVPSSGVREHASVRLQSGSTVLLYTDGLVETRDGDLEDGLAELVRRVGGHDPAAGPQGLVDRLLRSRADLTDDVALLAVRLDSDHPGGTPPC